MPKLKTHRGAAKRFRKTASGKFKRSKAMKSHILGKKNAKRRRRLGEPLILKPQDAKRAKALLGK